MHFDDGTRRLMGQTFLFQTCIEFYAHGLGPWEEVWAAQHPMPHWGQGRCLILPMPLALSIADVGSCLLSGRVSGLRLEMGWGLVWRWVHPQLLDV